MWSRYSSPHCCDSLIESIKFSNTGRIIDKTEDKCQYIEYGVIDNTPLDFWIRIRIDGKWCEGKSTIEQPSGNSDRVDSIGSIWNEASRLEYDWDTSESDMAKNRKEK